MHVMLWTVGIASSGGRRSLAIAYCPPPSLVSLEDQENTYDQAQVSRTTVDRCFRCSPVLRSRRAGGRSSVGPLRRARRKPKQRRAARRRRPNLFAQQPAKTKPATPPPTELQLKFSEAIELNFAQVKVTGADGKP